MDWLIILLPIVLIAAMVLLLWGLSQRPHFLYEFVIVLGIISVALWLTQDVYRTNLHKAQWMEAYPMISMARVESSLHYATQGHLPQTVDDSLPLATGLKDWHSQYVHPLEIQDNSVLIRHQNQPYQISLRPALAKQADQMRSLMWLCAEQVAPPHFQVVGRNHTRLSSDLLPAHCRG